MAFHNTILEAIRDRLPAVLVGGKLDVADSVLAGYLDQVEAQLTTLDGRVDGVEGKLDTIIGGLNVTDREDAVLATPVAPAVWRTAVVAADLLAAPTAPTPAIAAGGSLTDGQTYKSKILYINAYGRTTSTAGTDRAATAVNKTLRITPAVPPAGVTHFGVYVSTDVDPKHVCRIAVADVAAGCVVTAVDTYTLVGGTPGSIDVQVTGTGLQSATAAAQNTALVPVAGVDSAGKRYVDFFVKAIRTGDSVALSVLLLPLVKDSRDGVYYMDATAFPLTLSFGGTSGSYNPLVQLVRVEARGRLASLAVLAIAGTGASLDIDWSPS